MRQSARKPIPKSAFASLAAPTETGPSFGEMSTFEKVLDVLSRPTYASAGAAKSILAGGDPFTGAWKGFTAADRATYSDVLSKMGVGPGIPRGVAGFALDVALDPTTYLTFGTGAGAKVAFGGVTKTLTAAGKAVHGALAAERAAKIASLRSEERRVGKEGRSRWSPDH